MKRSHSLGKSLDDVKYEQYVNNLHDRLPQLTDPSDIDCQRWPWELLQNAKDTVVTRKKTEDRYVDVKIKYYTDNEGKKKLYFQKKEKARKCDKMGFFLLKKIKIKIV